MRNSACALFLFAFVASGCASAQRAANGPRAAPTEKVDTAGEEVAVAATRDGAIVAAWIAPNGIEVARSTDGTSFEASVLLHAGDEGDCDPAIAVRDDGTIEVAWLAMGGKKGDEVVFASGALQDLPLRVSRISAPKRADVTLDKPAIAVTRGGATLVSYLSDDDRGRHVVVARRASDGSVQSTEVNENRSVADPTLCAAPDDDRVWVAYATNEEIVARFSDDAARTWSPAISVVSAEGRFDELVLPVTPPACVARGKDIWVVEGVTRVALDGFTPIVAPTTLGSDALVLTHGSPETSFEAEVLARGDRFLDPTITREDDGTIDVVAYDGRGDDDADGALRWWRWTEHGTETRTLAAVRYHEGRADEKWLGDYVGATIVEHALVVAYADNSFGASRIDLRRVRLPKS